MATPPVNWNNVSMLTPGMKNLGNQFNARWPSRDGASDGAVGDYAHQQGDSGHNPDDTQYHNAEWDSDSDSKSEIRAIDVDNDLKDPVVTMQMVIDHMRKLPNLASVIRYMIYNKKIYKSQNGFNPETYTGSSSHTEHAHFSGAYSDASDENKTFDFKFNELGDDVSEQDVTNALNKFFKVSQQGTPPLAESRIGHDAGVQRMPGKPYSTGQLATFDYLNHLGQAVADLAKAVADLGAKFDELNGHLEAHFSGIFEAEDTPPTK